MLLVLRDGYGLPMDCIEKSSGCSGYSSILVFWYSGILVFWYSGILVWERTPNSTLRPIGRGQFSSIEARLLSDNKVFSYG